jgi:hypothetical protein
VEILDGDDEKIDLQEYKYNTFFYEVVYQQRHMDLLQSTRTLYPIITPVGRPEGLFLVGYYFLLRYELI